MPEALLIRGRGASTLFGLPRAENLGVGWVSHPRSEPSLPLSSMFPSLEAHRYLFTWDSV